MFELKTQCRLNEISTKSVIVFSKMMNQQRLERNDKQTMPYYEKLPILHTCGILYRSFQNVGSSSHFL